MSIIKKTAYEKSTGNIKYTLVGPEGFLLTQETDDIGFVDGEWDEKTHVIVDGVVMEKPKHEVDRILREEKMNRIREIRTLKLSDSDWTQVGDAPVDKDAWARYRQALRDLPSIVDDPDSVVWPTPPN